MSNLQVLRDNRNDTQHPEQNEADENNENNENNDSKDDSNNEESQGQSRFEIMNNFLCKRSLSSIGKFYILFVFFPVVVSLCAIYAAAIFLPPEARKQAPLFLWTDGGLILHRNSIFIKDKGYTYTICPRESICSEGWIQIFLILQYLDSLPLPLTFSWLIRFFPKYIAQHIISHLLFHSQDFIISTNCLGNALRVSCSFLHTIGHIIRWSIRKDMAMLTRSQVGLSGLCALMAMFLTILVLCHLGQNTE